jgi:hypothetical protein
MTLEDLARWELELAPLVPRDAAARFAAGNARQFNADAEDVRAALLDPIRALLSNGTADAHLVSCLERVLAELSFWKRVLLQAYPGAFDAPPGCPDCLLRYLLS